MAYTPLYSGADIANEALDVAGAFLGALVSNAGTLATIIIVSLIVGLIAILIGKTLGIIPKFK